jgi:fatty acid synthase subunit beta
MSQMMTNNSLVKIKDAPPYAPELERKVLLNSMARATYNPKTRNYSFTKLETKVHHDAGNVKAIQEVVAASGVQSLGVGVDQGKKIVRIGE